MCKTNHIKMLFPDEYVTNQDPANLDINVGKGSTIGASKATDLGTLKKIKGGHDPKKRQTKKKLSIYEMYIPTSLRILLRLKHIQSVTIYDVFAGEGSYVNATGESAGSSIIAADAIKIVKREFPDKDIILIANEKNKNKYKSLEAKMRPYEFVKCSNSDAKKAIERALREDHDDFKLFFIDPYGYRDAKLYIDLITNTTHKSECFLFIPVTLISQFISKGETNASQRKGIANFCNDYGINAEKHKEVQWHAFGKTIQNAMESKHYPNYVGFAPLATDNSHIYGLYFITKHPYGKEKFMEFLKTYDKSNVDRPDLYNEDIMKFRESIKFFLRKPKTNCEIYLEAIQKDVISSECREILLDMQKNESICVERVDGKKYKKGSFFISHKAKKTIVVQLSTRKNGMDEQYL